MKYFQMMLLLLMLTSFSFASISDVHGFANDGTLSYNEYGYNVKVTEDSILTVTGGGATSIDVKDYSHLQVNSTSKPLIDFESGISWIVPSDNSTVTVSGGIINYIYVQKDATVLLNGGQVNLIRSIQKPTAGITITIDCMPNSWSWIGEVDNYTGITGKWKNGDDFSITFLNDTILYTFPDTWTHVRVTPEPTTMLMFGLGGLLLKRRVK